MRRKEANERVKELQRVAGSHARGSIAVGPMENTLTEEARRLNADVLVIGGSPQTGALGRLLDLSYAVIRDAPCPALSV